MQLFRFANPDYLYLLLLLPLVVAIWIFNNYRRNKALARLGDQVVVERLMPDISPARSVLKLVFWLLALIFLILTVSRPQFGSKLEEVKRKGIEAIIALDVSNSMLAKDIQPDRLERAKQAISRLVENLTDDKIGLIVFAGDAYTQIPVTTDYISARMFLSTIRPDLVPVQGTAIGSAIDLAMRSFSQGTEKSRAIILITDGENHEDDAVAKAREAAAAGIVIYTIGIGSPEGVPISVGSDASNEYLRDKDGNTVITRLDENVLKEIASVTNGKYIRASNSNIGLEQLYNDIGRLKKKEIEGTVYTEYNDQFQIFCAAGILFLLIDFMIMEKKNRRLRGLKLFKIKI
ncbi:MAG: VWA domain-containing protein [Bacteroidales bacterium]